MSRVIKERMPPLVTVQSEAGVHAGEGVLAHQLTDECYFEASVGKWDINKNGNFYINMDLIEKRWHSGSRAWILVRWESTREESK